MINLSRDRVFPMTFNRPYSPRGIPAGRAARKRPMKWSAVPRRAHLRNHPDPTITGELLFLAVTSGV